MTQPPAGPEPPEHSSPPESPDASARPAVPADPERGLRGAMSAILVLETIVILLGIAVATKTGNGAGPVGVGLICGLAAAHLAACAVVARPYAVPVICALQVLLIACWAISGPLGIMGIVFALVWLAVLYMRREFRRRQAAGTLPGQSAPPPSSHGGDDR